MNPKIVLGGPDANQDPTLQVLMRNLRLMATEYCIFAARMSSDGHGAKPQKENLRCQSKSYTLWRVSFVWCPLGKGEKARMSGYITKHVSLGLTCFNALTNFVWWLKKPRMPVSCLHVVTRKFRLMATRQSRKRPGCQSSVYMFWYLISPDGHWAKPNKNQDVSSVYRFWRVNFVDWAKPEKPTMSVSRSHILTRKLRLMAIGQSQKNPGRQSTFTCFDLQTPSDGDWAKPQKPRMLAEHASNTDHEVSGTDSSHAGEA